MEIISFTIEQLRKPGVYEFLHVFIEELEKFPSVVQKSQKWFNLLKAKFLILEKIYRISHKSDATEEIFSLDGRCNGIHTAIKAAVNSMRKSMNEAESRAATSVWNTLNSFPYQLNANYIIKMGQADNLIEILQNGQAANVEAIGLTSLVAEFKKINDSIHELVDSRDDENVDKTKGDFEFARRESEVAYRNYVKFINAYILVMIETPETEDADMTAFVGKSNAIIERYRRNLTHQPSGNPPAADPDKNPDEEQTPPSGGEEDDSNNPGGSGSNNPGSPNNPGTPTPDPDPDPDPDDDPGEGDGDDDAGFGR